MGLRTTALTASSAIWLIAGLGCITAGTLLVMTAFLELGLALAALGVSLCAVGAIALLRPKTDDPPPEPLWNSAKSTDLDLHEEGLSPTERAYRRLLGSRDTTADNSFFPTSLTLDDKAANLGELIRDRCDHVWEGIRTRRYVKRDADHVADLNGGAIFNEMRDIVQEVATLYHSKSDNAVLEVRAGDLILALRSAASDLLQTAHQMPYVDPTTWSIQEVMTRLEQVSKGLALYKKLSPYEHYVTGAMLAARFVAGSSPLALAAWTIGKEGAKRVGSKFIKSQAESWLKTLLEGAIALLYLQVARTYDPTRAYRSPEWVALAEALQVHAAIPGNDRNRKLLLDRILRAKIPDEFAKLALLRALAEDRPPDTHASTSTDWTSLAPTERQAIAGHLSGLFASMQGLGVPAANDAIDELEYRLQWGVSTARARSHHSQGTRISHGFTHLTAIARAWLSLDREDTYRAIWAGSFGILVRETLGDTAARRALSNSVAAVYEKAAAPPLRPAHPPSTLAGDAMAEALVTSLVDLLTASRRWPIEHDHMVLLNASVLLTDAERITAVWKRYIDAATFQLGDHLQLVDLSTWPPRSSPAILRQMGPNDRPVAVLEARTAMARACWTLWLTDRIIIGNIPENDLFLDDGNPATHGMATVRLSQRSQQLTTDLVVGCGSQDFTVVGNPLRRFKRRFGPLFEALNMHPS